MISLLIVIPGWRDQNIDHYSVHLLVRACWVGRRRIALSTVQYVVLGPRLKIILLNILPESKRNELKYSLNLAFMFFSIVVKWQVPNLSILLVIRKKVTVLDGPWSATRESTWECDSSLQKRIHHNISCISICLFLIQSCYKLILSAVKKLLKTLYVFEILRKQFL